MRILVLLILLISINVHAQEASNLLLLDVSTAQPSKIKQAEFLTDNDAYTNQPHFINGNNELYYTQALGEGDAQQMDSMLYSLDEKRSKNLTQSTTSEYSPTPYLDGFSTILVDEKGTQWLWEFDNKGASKGKLSAVEPIGYHVWTSSDKALAFVLGEPHTLQLLTVNGGAEVLDERIGPSLWPIPGSANFSYTRQVDEGDDAPWQLVSYNPEAKTSTALTELPTGGYYYAWLPDGSAVTAVNNMIQRWEPSQKWQPWLDVSEYCKSVTRLHARSLNTEIQLVLVCS